MIIKMLNQKVKLKFTIYLCIIVCLILFLSYFFVLHGNENNDTIVMRDVCNVDNTCEQESLYKQIEDPFALLDIEAKAVLVWDIKKQNIIFSKNDRVQLPLASLTKVMTVLVATELLPKSIILTVEEQFLKPESDDGLLVNERWSMDDLVDFTLMKSSNDGALALASVAGALGQQNNTEGYAQSIGKFTHEMNAKARELKLKQTFFTNGTGLDQTSFLSGSYGSAHDMALLFEHALEEIPHDLSTTRFDSAQFISISGFVHKAVNTNEIVNKIPGLIAGKTGYTDLAGGNLVVAFDAGPSHPIIVVVLNSTKQGRFKDAEDLIWASLEYLSLR